MADYTLDLGKKNRAALETALEIVGEAATGLEALERVRSERADVVVMDIRMPDLDGIEASRRITADESPAGVKVLVLTTFETEELVVEATAPLRRDESAPALGRSSGCRRLPGRGPKWHNNVSTLRKD
jgi:CheY-like chemotaxis protein